MKPRTMTTQSVTAAVLLLTLIASAASAQSPWRRLAEQVPPGTPVKVRLVDGRRFSAVIVQARADDLLLQPRTRQPVPVQPVRYVDIASIERTEGNGGLNAAKAVAIGAGVGGGVFLGLLMALLSSLD